MNTEKFASGGGPRTDWRQHQPNYNATGPAEPVPTPVSPIGAQMTSLDMSISELHELLTDLEKRLAVILSPKDISTAGGDGPSMGSLLSQGIFYESWRVNNASARVRMLLSQLEV